MNLPNKLTILRLFMTIAFVIFFILGKTYNTLPSNSFLYELIPTNTNFPYYEMSTYRLISLIIFILASITDALDGYIARKYNMITSFGKLLDPLADKVLVAAALLCLMSTNEVPLVGVLVVIIREFTISAVRLVATDKGIVIAASNLGKVKTISQMISTIMLLSLIYRYNDFWFILTYGLYFLSVIFTVLSLIDYVYKNRDVLKDN